MEDKGFLSVSVQALQSTREFNLDAWSAGFLWKLLYSAHIKRAIDKTAELDAEFPEGGTPLFSVAGRQGPVCIQKAPVGCLHCPYPRRRCSTLEAVSRLCGGMKGWLYLGQSWWKRPPLRARPRSAL